MIENYIYDFKAPNGVASKCRIRTFLAQDKFHKNDLVVVCSQLPDDEEAGMSVTNAAETIATSIMLKHQIQPMRMIWIEHYPARGRRRPPEGKPEFPETFDRVTFDIAVGGTWHDFKIEGWKGGVVLRHAQWTHRIEREFIEQLIGEKFPET